MAEPLDFGKFAQTAIAFQNLQETVRRNDSYEQNVAINMKQAEADLERAKRQQFKDLFELSNDPRIKASPVLGPRVLTEAIRAAGFKDVDEDMIRSAEDQFVKLGKAAMDADPIKAHDAAIEIQVMLGPEKADKFAQSLSGFQKAREHSENVKALRQLQQARFEKIDSANAKVDAGKIPYQQGVRDFIAALDGTDSKEFERGIKVAGSLSESKKPTSDTAFSDMMGLASKAVESFISPEMVARAEASGKKAAEYGAKLQELKQSLQLVEAGARPPVGKSKRDLIEQIAVGERMIDAYSTLAEWQRKPFDRTLLKKAQEAKALMIQEKKNLETTHAGASEELIKLRQDALEFRQTEAGKKDTYEKNVGKAQAELLEKYGYTPEAGQLGAVATKYGVKTSDILPGLSNPAKKGKLEVEMVKMGQEDVSRQFKAIEAAQDVSIYANRLIELIKKNPGIVGRTAQLGTALAGAGQQLRALAGLDQKGTRFLDTKTRDEAEALNEILVYRMAKTMDPTGALDLNVVKNARTVLGSLDSLTTGPRQKINKIRLVMSLTKMDKEQAQQYLKGGPEVFMKDLAKEPLPGSMKPIEELSNDERFNEIRQFLEQRGDE